jgi:TP901 family phage tail tape measure protein
MTEIYRKIGFDAADAIAQLQALGEAVDSTGKRLATFDKSSAFRGGGGLNKGLQDSKAALVGFSDGSKVAIKSLDELVQQAQNAKNGLKPLNDGIHESEKRAKRGASTMKSFAKSIGSLLAIRTVIGIFNTFTGVLASTTQEAREFGLAIAEIQTIAGSLNTSSSALNRQVLDLSSALGTDALDTAKGLYQVLSNQVVEAGESFEFLATAQKLAITTVASTGEAVDALSSVMNAYGNEAGTAAEVSDTLFEAVNVGRFTLNEIANIIGRVTPLTAQMGISWNETAAAIAAMTQSGVRADTAITQLRAVVVKLLKPTEEMNKLYQSWGVKDGPTAIKTFGGLQGVLNKISQETNGSTAEMTKFFNEVRGLAGVLGLNIDNGDRFAKVLDQIEDSAGAAAKAFQGFQASDAQQLTKEMTRLKNEVIALGQALQPVASFFTTGFADIAAGLRVITEDVRGRLDATVSLEQRVLARRAAAQQANSKIESQFTSKQTEEAKIREQVFLQSIARQQKRFNEFIQASDRSTKVVSDRLKKYGEDLKDSFSDALSALEDRVATFRQRVDDSVKKSADIQLKIDDEELRQDLKKAFNPFQKQKLLDEDADAKTYEALNQLREAGTKEELASAQAAAERAIAAQRARESSADQVGDFRRSKDAQQEILDLLNAQKTAQDDFTKQAVNQRDQEIKKLDQLKVREGQLETLIKQRKEAIDRVIESREGERKAALQSLTDIDAQIKKLGFTKEGFDLFKTFDAGRLVNDFNNKLTGIDTQRINWDAAVSTLEQRLAQVKLKIQLETPAGDAQAFAQALGIDFDPQDLSGTAANVSKESQKILDDQVAINQQLKQLANDRITAEGNLKDSIGTTLDLVSDSAKRESDFNTRRKIETQEYRGDLEGALQTIRDTQPELGGVIDKIQGIGEQIRAQDYEGAKSGINEVSRTVDILRSKGTLTDKAYRALQVLLGQTLPASIDNLGAKTDKLKALQDIAPKAEVAQEWLNIQNRVGGAEARAKGLLDAQGRIPASASSAASSVKVIGDEYQRSANEASSTANITASLGSTAQAQVGGVNALASAYAELALQAQAAAAAQAAAGGAVPAAKGRYFAQGGSALKPLGTDTIPAMIQRGEFVTNAKSSRKFFSELNAINQDKQPVRRREGGSVTQVGDIHVAVNGGDTSRQTVRAIAVELNRELKRGTIRLGSLRKA